MAAKIVSNRWWSLVRGYSSADQLISPVSLNPTGDDHANEPCLASTISKSLFSFAAGFTIGFNGSAAAAAS